MPIDKHGTAYREGKQAFQDGVAFADKPMHLLLGEWEAGWIDALGEVTRSLLQKNVKE